MLVLACYPENVPDEEHYRDVLRTLKDKMKQPVALETDIRIVYYYPEHPKASLVINRIIEHEADIIDVGMLPYGIADEISCQLKLAGKKIKMISPIFSATTPQLWVEVKRFNNEGI